MSFYEWTESMSVGVDLIDSDHKALIDLINLLHESISGERSTQSLQDVFDRLIAYTEIHFAREEKVMQACGFPGLTPHQDEHAEFTERVYEIRTKLQAGDDSPISDELLVYLKRWLNAHILIQDMAYKPYASDNDSVAEVAQSFGPGLFEQRADLK